MTLKQARSIMDVDENATPDDIKKAYRRIAKQCHPDIGGSNGLFAMLNEANDILTGKRTPDPDGSGAPPPPPPPKQEPRQEPKSEPRQEQGRDCRQDTGPSQERTRATAQVTLADLARDPDFVIPPHITEQMLRRNKSLNINRDGITLTIEPGMAILTGVKFSIEPELHIRKWKSRLACQARQKPMEDIVLKHRIISNPLVMNTFKDRIELRGFESGFVQIGLTLYGQTHYLEFKIPKSGPVNDQSMHFITDGSYHSVVDIVFVPILKGD